ncbi:thioredoxin family protein [Winogradskyella sp.]|uniref:thioredoxin family protein n=1 Tax=Winogradskyella sp. TaxID=1883156 RepID=UPI0035C79164
MKNYLIIAILCLFTTVNFAQEIIWEKDYPKALRLAEQKNALILIFFTDGRESSIEENIKRNFLKSKNFKKSIRKSIIILHIDESTNSKNTNYNSRVISAYNPNKKFPSVKVILPRTRKSTSLLTTFNEKDIQSYISEINSIRK